MENSKEENLKSVEDFDAIVIHQRGIEFNDMPKKRLWKQYYVHWVVESAQYLYMDIHKLGKFYLILLISRLIESRTETDCIEMRLTT